MNVGSEGADDRCVILCARAYVCTQIHVRTIHTSLHTERQTSYDSISKDSTCSNPLYRFLVRNVVNANISSHSRPLFN